MMIAAMVAICVFVVAFFYARRARRNTVLLQHYEECMSSFIADSETLLSADETPVEVVDMIEFVAEKASNRRGAQEFLMALVRHRSELSAKPAGEMKVRIDTFKAGNPALGRVFSRAMARGLLAMTFNGGAIGTFVRRLVLFDAKFHEERTQDLAAGFREINRHPRVVHAQPA